MKRNESFLIFCGLSIVLILIVFGIKIIDKGTNASFGGITGSLGNSLKVIYNSNFPSTDIEPKVYEYQGANLYKILPNLFEVPNGYEFSGWGVLPTGPVFYNENQYINLSNDLTLYAIWKEVIVNNLMYGDVNLDGVIDDNDYKLIDNYILDSSVLNGQALVNADVNIDGKVDIVDSDIIKQVCLGIDGYVGFLPDKPILIYELYDNSNRNDDTNEDNVNNDSNNEEDNNINNKPSDGSGGGTGTSGSGNGSSGSSSNDRPGNSSSGNGNKPSSSNKDEEIDNKEEVLEKEEKYNFKFMNDKVEYAETSCLILDDKTCMLVLPEVIPTKIGYKFTGWSIDSSCSKDIIKKSVSVNSNNTYYACFIRNEDSKENKDGLSEWIVVILIWIFAIFGIYRVIYNFKNKSN